MFVRVAEFSRIISFQTIGPWHIFTHLNFHVHFSQSSASVPNVDDPEAFPALA